MSISIATNVTSLIAQENLSVNGEFESRTIQRLTSGYRINSSGDDAAGLAIANKFRSDIAELSQGIRNANDGVSTLQIIDGGLNNISKILDRLRTLATQSASATFAGNRDTLNQEFQSLLSEITRQANNIGLASAGKYNTVNTVFIGGGSNAANAQVTIDLSGPANQVDSAGLGISTATVAAGGTPLTGNAVRLDAPGATFLTDGAGNDQTFTFNLYSSAGGAQTVTVALTGANGPYTAAQVLNTLDTALNPYGISSTIDGNGQLGFGGGTPFTVSEADTGAVTTPVVTAASTATNLGVYSVAGQAAYATGTAEVITIQNGVGTKTVNLTNAESVDTVIGKINAQTASIGIYAVKNAAGTGVSIQSASNFTASTSVAAKTFTAAGAQTVNAPSSTGSVTGNAVGALAVITNAIANLGIAQGNVGTGQNKLQYANPACAIADRQLLRRRVAHSRCGRGRRGRQPEQGSGAPAGIRSSSRASQQPARGSFGPAQGLTDSAP